MILFSVLLCALAALLAMPADALAWGPGVHTAAARFVLANLDLLPAHVAGVLAQFPNSFFYGCLSADFFVGKGTRVRPGHSHNWDAADRLLEAAHTPQLMSHALGYASHLAADVVAHSIYVPGVLASTHLPSGPTHVYIEMQADSRLTGGLGRAGKLSRRLQRTVDRSMVCALEKNPLSYQCRKRVFCSGERLSCLPGWNRSLMLAQRLMPLPDGRHDLDEMFTLSLRSVLDVLRDVHGTTLRGFDPIGSRDLALAKHGVRPVVHPCLSELPALPGADLQQEVA